MTRQPEPQQIRVPDDQIHYDEDLIYTYQGERFTGVAYEDVPGRGLEEISYVNGLQEGPAREWYPCGQLRGETMFRANGVHHGPDRMYREDGTLVSETFYEYDICVHSRTFAEDGSVVSSFDLPEDSPTFARLQRLRAQYG